MVDVDIGNVYVTDYHSDSFFGDVTGDTLGSTVVEIQLKDIKEEYTNQIITFSVPQAPKKGDTTSPEIRTVDLKRISATLQIKGTLITDSTDSAIAKKQNLIYLAGLGTNFGANGDSYSRASHYKATKKNSHVTIVWGQNALGRQQWVRGNITKLSFDEKVGAVITDGTAEYLPHTFDVDIQITMGKPKS